MSNKNPIRAVDGKQVACPASYQWKLEDVSSPDAGRSENGTMHKERIGQTVKIELSWNGVTTEEASAILKAFNPEYILVEYLDPMYGDYVTKEFYVGNRSAPMYNAAKNLWQNVSFNIIARGVV